MQKVFEEDWLTRLKSRYERPGISAPPIYRVATSEHWEPIRNEIENWFAKLSDESKEKMLHNLRNPDSFLQTFNELAVAGFLFKLGYDVEYESEIDKLTPDWVVKKDNKAICFVEVFSRNVSAEVESLQKGISELWSRLGKIPIGVGLFIRFEDYVNPPELTSGLLKKTVHLVRKWLVGESPEQKEIGIFNGMSFEVTGYNSKWSCVKCAGPTLGAFVVDDSPVKNSIVEKVNKYKGISKSTGLPLGIAVVPSFETAIEIDNLEDILFGEEVFADEPMLSVVIGLWRVSKVGYQTAIYHNEIARFPLSPDMLKI